MFNAVTRPEKVHGLIFDGAVLVGNLALVGVIPRLGDEVNPATGGILLLVAVLAQLTGARLKRESLSPRLAQRPGPPRGGLAGGFFSLLLFLHFLLFSMITQFSFALIGVYRGVGNEPSTMEILWMGVAFLIGGLTTYHVRGAMQPVTAPDQNAAGPSWLEYAGDALLWISVAIITRVFWDSLIALIEPAGGIGFSGQGLILLAAMIVLYSFFYLPARVLFLVEDYRSVWTWVQMLAAMFPVLAVILLG